MTRGKFFINESHYRRRLVARLLVVVLVHVRRLGAFNYWHTKCYAEKNSNAMLKSKNTFSFLSSRRLLLVASKCTSSKYSTTRFGGTLEKAYQSPVRLSISRNSLSRCFQYDSSEKLFYSTQLSAADLQLETKEAHHKLESTVLASELPNNRQVSPSLSQRINGASEDLLGILEIKGIRSRPLEGGTWNVADPLKWTQNFGRRSPDYEDKLKSLICLKPGDNGYFDVSSLQVPNVTIVRTKEQAKIVLEKLFNAGPSIFHACDTEVMDIDLKSVGPVGNGYVTCLSMYSGPDFDYGLGSGLGSCLWIDNLDDACGILQEFKEWFENGKYLKVWHNYGFDRHVMWNEGIDVKGFGGDTMHMARLQNTSRSNGYSLEALTNELIDQRKLPMKELFGIPRPRKDGSLGSLIDIPPVEEMQRDPKHRAQWIGYSCFDAKGTWLIREALEKELKKMKWWLDESLFTYYWEHMRPFGEVLTDMERRGVFVDAQDYLARVETQARKDREHHLQVFRKWAADRIGPDGLALNVASALQMRTFLFGGAVNPKTKENVEKERVFKVLRDEIPQDALEAYRQKEEKEKAFLDPEEKESSDPTGVLQQMKVAQLKELCKENGLKLSGKKTELQERLLAHYQSIAAGAEHPDDELESMSMEDLLHTAANRNLPMNGSKDDLIKTIKNDNKTLKELEVEHMKKHEEYKQISRLSHYKAEMQQNMNASPKYVDVTVKSIGLIPEKFTSGGMPSVTADVLRKLAGDPFADPPKYGTALASVGEEGCKALFSLCSIGSIDTMITNFLTSLQELADDQSRVHCSLNLNTETGRLSSRRPNLQNQPALEKDKYKIRKAFRASPGNNLIVADYGQLELRVLASLTKCKPMIDAFAAGGDFHSRTALDMFPHVREAVESGTCYLEWDYSLGAPDKPLLKDLFAAERRKAKTLNFSIAYGKTAHGLSQDWGVTKEEAESMLQAWYNARPEVKLWQDMIKFFARKHGETRTMMGRYRQLPDAQKRDKRLLQHALRASINTPIQGSAADIAMMAMIKINSSEKLKDLGWILLLQIHDEVMLEGPEETAEEAFELVKQCMETPWVYGLEKTSVPLTVDGSWKHKNWYDAK